VTKSFEELLALPNDEALADVTVVGQLFAPLGATAEGDIAIAQAGE